MRGTQSARAVLLAAVLLVLASAALLEAGKAPLHEQGAAPPRPTPPRRRVRRVPRGSTLPHVKSVKCGAAPSYSASPQWGGLCKASCAR